MLEKLQRAHEIGAENLASLPDDVSSGGRPIVLREAVSRWPFVREARQSDEAAAAYLRRFYNGRPVSALVAPPSERGRFFYRAKSKAMNFETAPAVLPEVLDELLQQRGAGEAPAIAVQAISAPDSLPGLEEENLNRFVPPGTHARVWIGNAVTVAPHFDVAENIACVVAGSRRFILFPPEQTANIYPGPMDATPAGVPISMVAMDDGELDRFPRYREALDAALVADLEPGDAIYIPYLWWHGVQSRSRFNVLVNYWFNRDEASAAYPHVALLQLAYRAFREMPPEHRSAWRELYEHYVFQAGGDPMEAIAPPHRQSEQPADSTQLASLANALRELLG
jgi:oxalate decarboxylase/phosphoglucose isomerase-like protein (cupin superfamily)